jgi:hypothetical protein
LGVAAELAVAQGVVCTKKGGGGRRRGVGESMCFKAV